MLPLTVNILLFFELSTRAFAVRFLNERTSSHLPAPIVIPASQDFDGNDGPWSSFTLQIGTPAQDIKVFISTAGYQTLAVVPEGCTPADPPDCDSLRGGDFIPSQSSTWRQNNKTVNGTFTLALEKNLGYTGNGEYGYDTVGLGWQGSGGPSLDQQIVGGIATKEFYLGMFGLNPRPTNFSTFDDPVPSYMANLKQENLVPSLSWSYTAGNQYRPGTVLGSLILGGYDSSRLVASDITFPFSDVDVRDLTVEVQNIVIDTKNASVSLVKQQNTIAAFIDSTVPYLYLPMEICEGFEDAFGITWNDGVQAYLVNDSLHGDLVTQNASVTFSIGALSGGADRAVDISLPYAAFDLIAQYPLVENTTRYFPLMRATNESQYTLGRTFLQEAYLIADYERRNFSVSQCNWNMVTQQHIVAIASLNEAKTHGKHSLSHGAVAGIAIGSAIGVTLLTTAMFLLKRKGFLRGLHWADAGEIELEAHEKHKPIIQCQELDSMMYPGHEIDGIKLPGYEVDGGHRIAHELGNNEPIYEMDAAAF